MNKFRVTICFVAIALTLTLGSCRNKSEGTIGQGSLKSPAIVDTNKPDGMSKEEILSSIKAYSSEIRGSYSIMTSFRINADGRLEYSYHRTQKTNENSAYDDWDADITEVVELKDIDATATVKKETQYANEDQVKLECRDGKVCVTVKMHGKCVVGENELGPGADVTLKRSALYVPFAYSRENVAYRFAQAISHLINLSGGRTAHTL